MIFFYKFKLLLLSFITVRVKNIEMFYSQLFVCLFFFLFLSSLKTGGPRYMSWIWGQGF